jgi:hypothetical protein
MVAALVAWTGPVIVHVTVKLESVTVPRAVSGVGVLLVMLTPKGFSFVYMNGFTQRLGVQSQEQFAECQGKGSTTTDRNEAAAR